MQACTRAFKLGRGWSTPLPDLDSPTTLVLAFAAPAFAARPEPLQQLAAAFPTSVVVGCSTAGEIHGRQVLDASISVAFVRLETGLVRSAAASITSAQDSRAAGEQIVHQLADPSLRGLFVLSEGTHVNGSALVAGINETVGDQVVVTGGLAGDGPRFERTWVFEGSQPCCDRVVAVGLYGEALTIGHGSRGGWGIFGPERLVTRSQGSVLYELDGKPALTLYREYLGELAEGLPATGLLFPLAITADGDHDRALVRTILAIDEDSQSLVFAGDIPEGWRAQLMQSTPDRLIGGAEEAAAVAASRSGTEPELAVAISCVGRRLVLGERTDEEIEATLGALPPGIRQVGFYSYGELAPSDTGACDLHNQTMTLTTLAEARP